MTERLNSVKLLFLLLIISLLSLSATPAVADSRQIKPLKTWTGRLDKALGHEYPLRKNFLTSQEELDKLWAAWRLTQDKPAMDFNTHLLLVATCPCSHISLAPRLDDGGDLSPGVATTRDLREDLAYIIALIPRQGIRTVEGKPL